VAGLDEEGRRAEAPAAPPGQLALTLDGA
jgi:hypothetical protein